METFSYFRLSESAAVEDAFYLKQMIAANFKEGNYYKVIMTAAIPLHGINKAFMLSYNDWEVLTNYLRDHASEIEDGTFDPILDTPTVKTDKPSRYPSMWSKICHSVNPHKYPLIYDSKVNKKLKVYDYNRDQFYDKARAYLNANYVNWEELTDEELYLIDSNLWWE